MPTTDTTDPFWADQPRIAAAYQAGTLTDEELTRWRRRRLTAVLRHVTTRSPFYRAHLAGVDVEAVRPADLPALPFTTKADLRTAMHDVLSGPVSEALIYYETTGTTGASTPCPRGPKDILASNAPVEESWRSLFAAHFGDRMPVIGLMGPTELYAFGDTFGAVAQNLGACHVKIWPESPRVGFAKALRLMKELQVEVIVCAPALCLSLAKAALHHGYDLERDFSVKLFCVLGEISTPEFAADVHSVWGAPVHPTLYGSQEALAIATGCAEQRMHVSQPNYLVEIVEPGTDRVIGDTGTGELVLTMLTDGIKPLVRYRTGDLVSIRRNDCGCDRPGDVVEVHGRVSDTLRLGGEPVHPAQLESAILAGVTGCLGYQVVIDADADGFDRVTVRLDLLPSDRDDQIRAQVARRLGAEFGVPAEVEITDALDPVTTTGAFVSWKAARIADRRAEPDPEVLTALSVAGRYAHTT